MIFTRENAGDIQRYYRGTYIKLKETGDVLYYIRGVDSQRVTGQDQDGNEFELWLDDDFPYEVDYILPNKSVFQHGKNALMLQRTPAKQYQRGISEGNTIVQHLTASGSWCSMNFGFEVLKSFVSKQKYFSVTEAVANTWRADSLALSSRFSFLPKGKYIFCDQQAVARLVSGKFEVLCPVFRDDVVELVKGSQWSVK